MLNNPKVTKRSSKYVATQKNTSRKPFTYNAHVSKYKPEPEIPENSRGMRHKEYIQRKSEGEKRKEEEEKKRKEEEQRKKEEEQKRKEEQEKLQRYIPIPENATGKKFSDYEK